MKKSKRGAIDQFFASKKIAIAGVSRNEHKTGTAFFKEMKDKGMNVVGVNPHMKEILGSPCYASVSQLPDDVDAILTTVRPEFTIDVVKEAEQKGIKNLWMQLGSQSKEAIEYAESKGMNVIYKECVMMYCDPVESIHKFHRGLKKFFGGYHK